MKTMNVVKTAFFILGIFFLFACSKEDTIISNEDTQAETTLPTLEVLVSSKQATEVASAFFGKTATRSGITIMMYRENLLNTDLL
jgi:hypothetical protein